MRTKTSSTAKGAGKKAIPKETKPKNNGKDKPAQLSFHTLSEIFPLMEGAEFKALVADIKANGQHEVIVTHDEKILDGRNRYRACIEAGVTPRIEQYSGDKPLDYVISKNAHRRHLTESQRAMAGARIAQLKKGRPEKNGKSADIPTQGKVAKRLSVSARLIRDAVVVLHQGDDKLQQAVLSGRVAVSSASVIAKHFDHEKQRQLVADGAKELAKAIKEIAATKAGAAKRQTKQKVEKQDDTTEDTASPKIEPTTSPATAPELDTKETAEQPDVTDHTDGNADDFMRLKAAWDRASEQARQRFRKEVLDLKAVD